MQFEGIVDLGWDFSICSPLSHLPDNQVLYTTSTTSSDARGLLMNFFFYNSQTVRNVPYINSAAALKRPAETGLNQTTGKCAIRAIKMHQDLICQDPKEYLLTPLNRLERWYVTIAPIGRWWTPIENSTTNKISLVPGNLSHIYFTPFQSVLKFVPDTRTFFHLLSSILKKALRSQSCNI